MKEELYQRKKSTIFTKKGSTTYEYINQAKRKSRELQLAADGALGRGSLRVIK